MIATQSFYTVEQKSISRFVPSFIAITTMIHQMNFQMSFTHRFTQSTPGWLPPMTYLYISVLFIIQILRAQREVGIITAVELWLLESLEHTYDIKSLLIPGPLVPYFQALAAFAGPFENLGDVTPSLPWNWTCSAASLYMLGTTATNHDLSSIFPPIPFYMEMLNKIATHQGEFTTETMYQKFWKSTFGRAVTNNNTGKHPFYQPGAWTNVAFSTAQINNAKPILAHLGFPPALDYSTSGDISNWLQFMRIEHTNGVRYNWFGPLSGIMSRYAMYWTNSVPLSAISPTGTGASLPIWRMAANNTNLVTPVTYHAAGTDAAAEPAYFSVHHLVSIKAYAEHSDSSLEEIEEQTSAIAMVNVSLTGTGHAHTGNDGYRSGPVWDLPTVRRSPFVDYVNSIPANLATHYHEDTRVKRA
jgi:hypothetical protein